MKILVALAVIVTGLPLAHSAAPSGPVREWWTGERGSGDWLGLRPALKEHGIELTGKWHGTFYGVVSGGLARRTAFDEALHFDLAVDFARLTGWSALEGLTGSAGVRYRDGFNVNEYVGASSTFNPSAYQSGKQWRLMPFFLTYTTPRLFGVKNLLTLSGGWQDPYEHFAQQPEAKLFRNNAIISAKGISANGVGWSSSYAAWGGYLRVRPVDWAYAQAGIYLAIPGGSNTANHGLDLQGARPASRNGWFVLGETGVTPSIAGLPGTYAFGGYYWGVECTSYSGATTDGRFGFYAQADQMLWREPGPPSGKTSTPSRPAQGLRWFSFFNFAPPSNDLMPFYFQTGLTWRGLIPGRDEDRTGVAFALGNYSYDKILADYRDGRGWHQTYEALVEADYRIQLNRWAIVQPFLQYVIRPGGTGLVQNATVLGVHFGVEF